MIENLESVISFADSIACGPLSKAMSLPYADRSDKIRRECPPRPNVASTYVPFGSVTTKGGATSAITERCTKLDCIHPLLQH